MAKTQDFIVCNHYLINYMEGMKKEMNQYQMRLTVPI